MNRGEAWSAGSRGGSRGRSPASGQRTNRQQRESPATVDRSLGESSGNRGRGIRGRGRNSPGYANDEHSPVYVYVKKSPQVSNVGSVEKGVQQEMKTQRDGMCSTKQPDEDAALNFSGDHLQSSASSSTKNINLSGNSLVSRECEDKDLMQSSDSSSSKNINLSGGSFISRECEDKDVRDVKDGARMPCDLVNRMTDVSLSSTSGHKVKLSSVEDHNIALKSGDAGNSTNTSRFDIFFEKNVTRLKPTILELNREKRKASKGYIGIVLRPGMVLLKNYLSINDQVMIVNKCRKLGLGEGGFYQPGYRDGALLHLKMMCLGKNWDPETCQYGETRKVDGSIPPKIPVEFNQFVEKAIKESQSLVATNSKKTNGEDGIPFMSPDICIVNFYTSTGRLGLHQDKDESAASIRKGLPVVSFSIGDSAEFLYSDARDDEKEEMVVLESGDVLIFGGKSRKVFHGVKTILKDTAPKVLVQETSLRPGRLNLTFRQY